LGWFLNNELPNKRPAVFTIHRLQTIYVLLLSEKGEIKIVQSYQAQSAPMETQRHGVKVGRPSTTADYYWLTPLLKSDTYR